jgi:hypothetical protein
MDFPGDSAADLHCDMRAVLEGDLRTDSRGDSQSYFPADSQRDSQADLRRDLQRGLQGDFRCGFDRDLRAEREGTTDEHGWTQIVIQQTHCPTGASEAKSESRSESAQCRAFRTRRLWLLQSGF